MSDDVSDLDADEIERHRSAWDERPRGDEDEFAAAQRMLAEAKAVMSRVQSAAVRAADDAAQRVVNQREGAPLVTIGLDTPVDEIRRWSGDPDEPEPEPARTIQDVIVERAASMLAHGSRDLSRDVKARAMEMVEEEMREKVTALIEETLSNPIRKTNTWGEPTGEQTTLRELILKETHDWLVRSPSRDGFGDRRDGDRKASAQVLVKDLVESVMSRELAKEVEQAKSMVKERVQTTSAAVIAKAVTDGLQLGGR